MQTFTITSDITIVCEWAKTRNGFKHTATLMRNGYDEGSVKCNYLNRTWEAYEFDSVLYQLAESGLANPVEQEAIKAYIKARTSDRGTNALAAVGAMMALGNLFADTPEATNDWKVRILKAGAPEGALQMPDDWDTLPEAEKQKRLDMIIKEFTK